MHQPKPDRLCKKNNDEEEKNRQPALTVFFIFIFGFVTNDKVQVENEL